MDPDAALLCIRELYVQMTTTSLHTPGDLEDIADELAQWVEDLDTWLTNGGSLPKQWEADR